MIVLEHRQVMPCAPSRRYIAMRVEPHHDSPTNKSTSEGWKTVSHGLAMDWRVRPSIQ